MKYWTFDVCALIRDYPHNKKRVIAIEQALQTAEKFLETPAAETSRGDWEQYIRQLKLRLDEYLMYTGMVEIGFGDLPEVERLVLKFWLIDGYSDPEIVTHCGIKNLEELKKIKKLSLTKFTNIVMPD